MKSHPLKQHGGNGKQNNITAVPNDVRQQSTGLNTKCGMNEM
jgi:hypothetical protein